MPVELVAQGKRRVVRIGPRRQRRNGIGKTGNRGAGKQPNIEFAEAAKAIEERHAIVRDDRLDDEDLDGHDQGRWVGPTVTEGVLGVERGSSGDCKRPPDTLGSSCSAIRMLVSSHRIIVAAEGSNDPSESI